jgi:hypothetical protein
VKLEDLYQQLSEALGLQGYPAIKSFQKK